MSSRETANTSPGTAHPSESEPQKEALAIGRKRGSRSIAELGLNVLAAETGQVGELLPLRYRNQGGNYPLPTDVGELYRLTLIPLPSVGDTGRYLRRARKTYKQKALQKAAEGFETTLMVADGLKDRVKAAEVEIASATDRVKSEVAAIVASLADLHDMAKSVNASVMEAFLQHKAAANGEIPSIDQAISASSKILGHVQKLGKGAIEEVDKSQAEEELFKEFEATRERVANVVKH